MPFFFLTISFGVCFGLFGKGPETFVVETIVVKPLAKFSVERRYIGTIGAEKFSLLAPKETGIVASISVKPGQKVKKDQILVSLQSTIETRGLKLAEKNLSLVTEEYLRNLPLYPKDVTKAELKKFEQELIDASAKLEAQRKLLENVLVKAPFEGVAGVPRVVLGETVQANTPVISIMDPPFSVIINIPGSRLNEINIGQPVRVKESRTVISAVEKSIDPKTRTGFAKAIFASCDSCIVNDKVYVHITVLEKPNVILVSRNAIFYQNGKSHVVAVVKGKDGNLVAEIRKIDVGVEQDGQVEVIFGIKAFDEIVIANPKRLTQGALVKVVK